MSFDSMKLAELKQVAEAFGVDLEDVKNKSEVIATLLEEGVTYEMFKSFSEAEKDEEEVEEEDTPVSSAPAKASKKQSKNTVLVKMDRPFGSFETNGILFTREHPFVAVPEDIAQNIFDYEVGFRMATPREVQEYYS